MDSILSLSKYPSQRLKRGGGEYSTGFPFQGPKMSDDHTVKPKICFPRLNDDEDRMAIMLPHGLFLMADWVVLWPDGMFFSQNFFSGHFGNSTNAW